MNLSEWIEYLESSVRTADTFDRGYITLSLNDVIELVRILKKILKVL